MMMMRETDHISVQPRQNSSIWAVHGCPGCARGGLAAAAAAEVRKTATRTVGGGHTPTVITCSLRCVNYWCGAGGPPAGWRGPAGAAGSRDGGTGGNRREVVMQSFWIRVRRSSECRTAGRPPWSPPPGPYCSSASCPLRASCLCVDWPIGSFLSHSNHSPQTVNSYVRIRCDL